MVFVVLSFPVVVVGGAEVLKLAEEKKKILSLTNELEKDSHKIYDNIQKDIENKNYDSALGTVKKYLSTKDLKIIQKQNEIEQLQLQEKTNSLLQQEKNTPENKYEEKISIYKELKNLYPENQSYTDKIIFYEEALNKKKEAEGKKALAKLRKVKDEIEGTTWNYDPSSPRYNNSDAFHLYFATKGDFAYPLRLKISYHANDWLFINSFVVVADGQRFERNHTRFEKDNNHKIWEWYDEPMTQDDKKMIEAVINSKKAIIRFYGDKYHNDRTVSQQKKLALKNILTAHEAIRNGALKTLNKGE